MTPVTPEPLSEPELEALRQRRTILVHDGIGIGPDSYSFRVPLKPVELDAICHMAREALATRAELDKTKQELTAATLDAEFLHNLQAEFSPEDCDDCPDCGKLVMCSRHSFISALHRRTATTGEIERDYLKCCLEQARVERDRLATRSDEHLRAHTASFEALAHLSATLFDGEVDDYRALAEKVIGRVKHAEAERDRLRGVVEAAFSYRANRREIMGNTHDAVDALRALDAVVADLDALGPVRDEPPAPSATGAGR